MSAPCVHRPEREERTSELPGRRPRLILAPSVGRERPATSRSAPPADALPRPEPLGQGALLAVRAEGVLRLAVGAGGPGRALAAGRPALHLGPAFANFASWD